MANRPMAPNDNHALTVVGIANDPLPTKADRLFSAGDAEMNPEWFYEAFKTFPLEEYLMYLRAVCEPTIEELLEETICT